MLILLNITKHFTGSRTKQPILNGTKQPIFKTADFQNSRFSKQSKTADFKTVQNRRLVKIKTADFVNA